MVGVLLSLLVSMGLTYQTVKEVNQQLDSKGAAVLQDKQYRTYSDALHDGGSGTLMAADNGLAYKTKILGSNRYWAFDTKWIGNEDVKIDEIKDYVSDHKLMMFLRAFVLSDKTIAGAFLFIFLGFCGLYLLRMVGNAAITFYVNDNMKRSNPVQTMSSEEIREKKNTAMVGINNLLYIRLKTGSEFSIVTGIYAFLIGYTGLLHKMDMNMFMALAGIYLLLMVVVVIVGLRDVVRDIKLEYIKEKKK
ncbi:hypothetical protein [Bacillus mycoides]|uniref:hypothetical protein n=1 Tax=Bacillus mycoides TaxID=1405 RepID=UPI003A80DF1D